MKKIYQKVILFSLLFSVLFTTAPVLCAGAANDTDNVEKVKVGWYISDHFQEGDADGNQKSGYSYEYLQDVANYTGWEYEYVAGGWSELYAALLNGEIDVLAGISYTDERAEVLNFPNIEMGLESYYLYKRADNEEINSADLTTLNGKKVGTLENNLMTDYFEAWRDEKDLDCEEVTFNDFETRDEAFENGEIDAIIAVNNNVAANSGFTPVVMVGESSYYLAVAKDREDLLDELNRALASLNESNPFFIQSLQLKYFNHTAVNATLSPEESAWVVAHNSIQVGYIQDYMPYCNADSFGDTTGVITDIFATWQDQVELTDKIDIEYQSYRTYDDMIEALQNGEIDVAFPVYDSIASSEELRIVQTKELVDSSVHLIYRGEYQEGATTEKIAVSECSAFQKNFVSTYYPDSEIYEVKSLRDCLDAVINGKATCTFLDSVPRPYGVPLALAKGASAYIPELDFDFTKVFERADQAMYDDKKAYYEKHGDRRRR